MMDIGSLIANPTAQIANAQPQPTAKVTNLSDHVNGGTRGTVGTNVDNSEQETRTLWFAVGLVLSAVAILWIMGSLVFKKVSL